MLANARERKEREQKYIIALRAGEREHENEYAREPKEHEPKFEAARERGEHERICRQCSGARRAGAAALVLAMELTHERLASKIKGTIFCISYAA